MIFSVSARFFTQHVLVWSHALHCPTTNAWVRFYSTRASSFYLAGPSCFQVTWEEGFIELRGASASWTTRFGRISSVFCHGLVRMNLWNEAHPPVSKRQRSEIDSIKKCRQALQSFLRWLISYETRIPQILRDSSMADTGGPSSSRQKANPDNCQNSFSCVETSRRRPLIAC